MAVDPLPIRGERHSRHALERAQLALQGGRGRQIVRARPAKPDSPVQNPRQGRHEFSRELVDCGRIVGRLGGEGTGDLRVSNRLSHFAAVLEKFLSKFLTSLHSCLAS